MSAYVIVEVSVHDPERYEDYKKIASEAIAHYGGKYLARGGQVDTLEGDWQPNRLVILEFESMDQAKRWHDSEEYRPGIELRAATADSRMIVVEGL
jgi:uncharacterized protein (DUF1330 family)